jgi:hypothetical protein
MYVATAHLAWSNRELICHPDRQTDTVGCSSILETARFHSASRSGYEAGKQQGGTVQFRGVHVLLESVSHLFGIICYIGSH